VRRFLLVLILVEGVALASALGIVAMDPEGLHRRIPPAPVFAPPIHKAVGGDFVRYELTDLSTGRVTGFLEYKVERAIEYERENFGREFHLRVTEMDARGKNARSRTMIFRPRQHGFLPPVFDEDELPPGDAPVVKSIEPATMTLKRREIPGFLVEAIQPRWSTAEVRDRLWFTDAVPIFGVLRRQRDGVEWNEVDMQRGHR